MIGNLRRWARGIRRDTLALAYAVRDPRTPWAARILGAAVVAYAVSPIDLVPDFIPVLGYLDDLILLPLGLLLVRRLIPDEVLADARARADASTTRLRSTAGAAVVIMIWLGVAALLVWRFL
ncbi:MAG: DUF1232 domain-containing protein [Dehalococcoidia bacterium]